jgi:hypothetical protein
MPAMDRGAKLEAAERFPSHLLAQLHKGKTLRIRAGTGDHRVFVRSWSIKADGWYHTFLTEPHGAIHVGDRGIPVVAVRIADKRILDAIDHAYLEKYNTPGAIKYARDLGSPQSRAATLELRPF